MLVDWIRELCLSFPHATEQLTWGSDLTFRIAGKIFAVTCLEPAPVWLSFKCSQENFAELTERNGIIPAPYLARAKWVALEDKDALPPGELQSLLRESYELVFAGLPKKTQRKLSTSPVARRASRNSNAPLQQKRTKERRGQGRGE
jgi:predicted DNA-binding protein (MmcQ/YjbR family)